jgi:hypothetical protein
MPKRTINADGELVDASEADAPVSNSSPWLAFDRINAFGFSLEKKQFLVVLLLALVMLGPRGSMYTRKFVSI